MRILGASTFGVAHWGEKKQLPLAVCLDCMDSWAAAATEGQMLRTSLCGGCTCIDDAAPEMVHVT